MAIKAENGNFVNLSTKSSIKMPTIIRVLLKRLALIAAIAVFANPCQAQKASFRSYFAISGSYGYKNEEGKVILSPTFSKATTINDGFGMVSFDGKHSCLINEHMQLISDTIFPGQMKASYNGIFLIEEGLSRFSLYNFKGENILGKKYSDLTFDKGLIYGKEENSDVYKFFDGAGNQIGDGEFKFIRKNRILVSKNEDYGYVIAGEVKGHGETIMDGAGNNLLSNLTDIEFLESRYFLMLNDAADKYEKKHGHSRILTVTGDLIAAKPKGSDKYGVYLLNGKQILAPKMKTVEKAAKEMSKKIQLIDDILKDGSYDHDMKEFVDKIEKINQESAMANLAMMNADKAIDIASLPIVYPMVEVKTNGGSVKTATSKTKSKGTRSKGKSRSKSAAAKSYSFVSAVPGVTTNSKVASQKFDDIKSEGICFIGRTTGSPKYKLYNVYGLAVTDKEYDEITTWGYNKDDAQMFMVRDDKKWGIININGDERTMPWYDSIEITDEDTEISQAEKDGKYYLINGQSGIPINSDVAYDEIKTYLQKDGKVPVVRGGYETYVGKDGKEDYPAAEQALDAIIKEAWTTQIPENQFQSLIDKFTPLFKSDLITKNDVKMVTGKYLNFLGEYSAKVWQDLNNAESWFKESIKRGYGPAANNLEIIKAEKKKRKSENLLNTLAAVGEGLIAAGNAVSSGSAASTSYSSTDADSDVPEAKSGMSEATYRNIYQRHERNAKSAYESLTMMGTRTSKGGKATKGTANGYWGNHYSGLKTNLRKAQQGMVRTRQEARKAGFTIQQSNYETVTVTN